MTSAISALQFIVLTFFWLIRSLTDSTLAAFIVCGPLQFLVCQLCQKRAVLLALSIKASREVMNIIF